VSEDETGGSQDGSTDGRQEAMLLELMQLADGVELDEDEIDQEG
jgi:hypothetical protein